MPTPPSSPCSPRGRSPPSRSPRISTRCATWPPRSACWPAGKPSGRSSPWRERRAPDVPGGEMVSGIGGVIGAPVTPFTGANTVDLDITERLCGFLVGHGVHALALPLHTGESLNLTGADGGSRVECAVSAAGGRVPVYAHVSLPGTDQVIELAQHAEKAGAAAVIVVTPYHWRPPPAALLAHFTAVAQAVAIDVLAYNFPGRLGGCPDADLLAELIGRCGNFAGVKDASYDMQSFTEACARTSALRPGFAMLTGVEYLLTSMPVGGARRRSRRPGPPPAAPPEASGCRCSISIPRPPSGSARAWPSWACWTANRTDGPDPAGQPITGSSSEDGVRAPVWTRVIPAVLAGGRSAWSSCANGPEPPNPSVPCDRAKSRPATDSASR